MKPVKNWKQVAGRSWSSRCHLASAGLYSVVAGSLMFWPALQEHIPLIWFCLGAIGLNLAGFVLRIVDQGIAGASIGDD